ncbi:VSP [Giardia lamblia P15]|uniref:VSP n=1 Tax=Giardia intestinalis (strain P15) TaxID=658858 RepID=E1F3S1_GIAIA|nr:VSP [Giardia lamblia P15]
MLCVGVTLAVALGMACSPGGDYAVTCANDKCELVDGIEVCTECKAGGVPIDGFCWPVSSPQVITAGCTKEDGASLDDTATTCGTCSGAGHFLFMGGCYRRRPGAIMQTPDPVLCPEAASGSGNCKTGKCFTIEGFDKLSYCSQCADNTEVPLNGACERPEETQACIQMSGGICTQCAKQTFMYKGGCYPKITIPGVKMCKEAADGVCTSPAPGYFVLPADDRDASHQSVVSCGDSEGALGKSAKIYKGVKGCAECTLSDSATTATCNKCSDKNLSPLKDECMENCPAGTYLDSTGSDGNVCRLCHESCASCEANNASTSCKACYSGYVLNRDAGNKGTCIPECTGKYAENCEANQCTAVVGGPKYCSKCKAGFVPVNGICAPTTPAGREATGCTPSENNDGTCKACTTTYFLESGGCYKAGTFPGNTLCTTANDGKCQACANGQKYTSEGSCPSCSDGCASCTGTPTARTQECQTCFAGYYFDGVAKVCKKCSETSGTITGVKNCISCAPPISGSGPVICYVKKDGTSGGDSGTGGSTNKGGLSTGAIAGIAVAVVIVVGGLVGFLCWWFICRGKA